MEMVSPNYMMKLIERVDKAIWKEYSSYKNVLFYIRKWHEGNNPWNENFVILYFNDEYEKIDLSATLHNMDAELVIKIAIDLGIETPGFLPSIPIFRNEIKADYDTASLSFEKSFKFCETEPATAIGFANSALESIIKKILSDERITISWKEEDTLYKLAISLLKEFKMNPNGNMPNEIKTIGSSLLNIAQSVETLRSTKTDFHGKQSGDDLISDPLYVYFVLNTVTTVGMFLMSYYEKHYPKYVSYPSSKNEDEECDLPF